MKRKALIVIICILVLIPTILVQSKKIRIVEFNSTSEPYLTLRVPESWGEAITSVKWRGGVTILFENGHIAIIDVGYFSRGNSVYLIEIIYIEGQ